MWRLVYDAGDAESKVLVGSGPTEQSRKPVRLHVKQTGFGWDPATEHSDPLDSVSVENGLRDRVQLL